MLSFSAGVPSKLQSFAVSAENITAPDGGRTNSNSAAGDVAPAAAAASPPPPLKGCLFPHHTQPFCDESKSAAQRAALLANLLTVPELISAMQVRTLLLVLLVLLVLLMLLVLVLVLLLLVLMLLVLLLVLLLLLLIPNQQGDTPAIKRLGIPLYHYGYEALHGMIQNCPCTRSCCSFCRCCSC